MFTSATELVRESLQHCEVLTALHPASTRNHDPCTGQIRALRLTNGLANPRRQSFRPRKPEIHQRLSGTSRSSLLTTAGLESYPHRRQALRAPRPGHHRQWQRLCRRLWCGLTGARKYTTKTIGLRDWTARTAAMRAWVVTLRLSLDLTVANAFPAYMGRTNVFSSTIYRDSVIRVRKGTFLGHRGRRSGGIQVGSRRRAEWPPGSRNASSGDRQAPGLRR